MYLSLLFNFKVCYNYFVVLTVLREKYLPSLSYFLLNP